MKTRSETSASPTEILVRRAAQGDALGIATVHVAAWRETYAGIVPQSYLDRLTVENRLPIWERVLNDAQTKARAPQLHVAVSDVGIVGFADGGPSRSPELGFAAEMYAIYLMRAFQGCGVGRALFAAVARDQLAAERASLMLWVLAANPTLAFYQHLGGSVCAKQNIEIGGAALEELSLGWSSLAAFGAR